MADEGICALFDGLFDFVGGYVGEGCVEDVVGGRVEGCEDAVEEDCVQDACVAVSVVQELL